MKDIKTLIESGKGSDAIIGTLTEANELLKAQGMCKGEMFKAKKGLDPLMNALVKKGILEKWSSKVVPYNTGYSLKFDIKVDMDATWVDKKSEKEPRVSEDVARFLYNLHSIFLQPSSWFFEDSTSADSRLEGQTLPEIRNSYVSFRTDVKSKDAIKKATAKYSKIIEKDLKRIKSLLSTVK